MLFCYCVVECTNMLMLQAAIERAEGIKESDVEEVFFGNVLSAK